MFVTKASGQKEPFSPEKIERTCRRAGASPELARKVVRRVEKALYNGIPTAKILRMILKTLDKERPEVASRYDLKEAIMLLGPAGFAFEKLTAEVLRKYGWKTEFPGLLSGRCVDHEIDIIARKKENWMVECKYRNRPGIYIGIKEALYTWARFMDLIEGCQEGKCLDLGQPWLITNTKFSRDAIRFSRCRKMKLIGWQYPGARSFKMLLEAKKLYPVTVIRKIDKRTLDRLSRAGLMLCQDLETRDIRELRRLTGITPKILKKLKYQVKKILEG